MCVCVCHRSWPAGFWALNLVLNGFDRGCTSIYLHELQWLRSWSLNTVASRYQSLKLTELWCFAFCPGQQRPCRRYAGCSASAEDWRMHRWPVWWRRQTADGYRSKLCKKKDWTARESDQVLRHSLFYSFNFFPPMFKSLNSQAEIGHPNWSDGPRIFKLHFIHSQTAEISNIG